MVWYNGCVLRYYPRVLMGMPKLMVHTVAQVEGGLALAVFVIVFFNQPLAKKIGDWDGIDPLWALVPLGALFVHCIAASAFKVGREVEREQLGVSNSSTTVTGTYIGDGSDPQLVPVGSIQFQPKSIHIGDEAGQSSFTIIAPWSKDPQVQFREGILAVSGRANGRDMNYGYLING